jgi:hypothetical protein
MMKMNRLYAFAGLMLLIAAIKVVFFYVQKTYGIISVGGTSDAEYYEAIALGALADPNPWGVFLKFLNDWGLYSRLGVAFAISLMNAVLVPWLYYKLIAFKPLNCLSWLECGVMVTLCLYPTVLYYTVDIYRDIPMIAIFLVAMYAAKHLIGSAYALKPARIVFLLIILSICVGVLYILRFYLAAAMLIALAACFMFDLSKSIQAPLALYVVALTVANILGVFNWMKIDYRLTYAGANSAFGIDFSHGYFWVNFFDSALKGLYGFYFHSRMALVMFVCESIPALLATAYVVLNRKYIDRYAGFLLIFFVAYASIWVIGVDSLGTAARYRIFNYIAIMLAACAVYSNKDRLGSQPSEAGWSNA